MLKFVLYLCALIVPGVALKASGWSPHWIVWVVLVMASLFVAHLAAGWLSQRYEPHRYYTSHTAITCGRSSYLRAQQLKRHDPEHFAEILGTMQLGVMQRTIGFEGEQHLREQGWSEEDAEVAAVASFLRSADRQGLARG